MPEHLGAKKRALCGPFENLKDASAQEIVALLAYARGALQAKSAFRELATPLEALFALEQNIIDGIGISPPDQLEQAIALIRICAGNELQLEAALKVCRYAQKEHLPWCSTQQLLPKA